MYSNVWEWCRIRITIVIAAPPQMEVPGKGAMTRTASIAAVALPTTPHTAGRHFAMTPTRLIATAPIRTGGGILLYGPPGTGKTYIAKAVAGEVDAVFYSIKPSEIMSKWVGESEQNVNKLFQGARNNDRSVIFIDEVESLIPRRRTSGSTVMQRVVPHILAELEGVESKNDNLLFIGATNEPWSIDPAALRPGRFDEKIYVPPPDFGSRRKIFELNLKRKPLSGDVELDKLAELTDGYSGADIRHICLKTSLIPFKESYKLVMSGKLSLRIFLKLWKI